MCHAGNVGQKDGLMCMHYGIAPKFFIFRAMIWIVWANNLSLICQRHHRCLPLKMEVL